MYPVSLKHKESYGVGRESGGEIWKGFRETGGERYGRILEKVVERYGRILEEVVERCGRILEKGMWGDFDQNKYVHELKST